MQCATRKKHTMIQKYKFPLDKRAWAITAIVVYIIIFAMALVAHFFGVQGTYVSAWFNCFVFFVVALFLLSKPSRMLLFEDRLEVRCLLKLVVLEKTNIATVRRVPRAELKFIIPILASFGFCGYYGLYFNLSRRRFVWIYAGEWENFVQITDKQGTNCIVSVRDSREIISTLRV